MDSKTAKGEKKTNTFRVKAGLAQMLKGGGTFVVTRKYSRTRVFRRFIDEFEDGERRSTLTYSIRNEELTPNTIEQHTVIMDVMNPQQARVAEEAGAVAVVRTLSLSSLS